MNDGAASWLEILHKFLSLGGPRTHVLGFGISQKKTKYFSSKFNNKFFKPSFDQKHKAILANTGQFWAILGNSGQFWATCYSMQLAILGNSLFLAILGNSLFWATRNSGQLAILGNSGQLAILGNSLFWAILGNSLFWATLGNSGQFWVTPLPQFPQLLIRLF
jgi:hypothetical protein